MATCTTPSSLFQFTHPGGVRRELHTTSYKGKTVSIHAPGRGATVHDFQHRQRCTRFNSRTREGCDYAYCLLIQTSRVSIHAPGRGATSLTFVYVCWGEFQFTHPGGVRPRLRSSSLVPRRFQFTHPGGVRLRYCLYFAPLVSRFQFTHPGGVRLFYTLHNEEHNRVSIHAPGRGATVLSVPVLY